MRFLVASLLVAAGVIFGAQPLPTRTRSHEQIMKSFNLALESPRGWIRLYPSHDRCLFLADSKEGGVRQGACTVDVSVGLRQERDSEETLLKRITGDFPQAKSLGTEQANVLGSLRRVHVFSYEISGPSAIPAKLAVCLVLSTNIYYEALLFGITNGFDEVKPAFLNLLHEGRFLDEPWTVGPGQISYLKGVIRAAGGKYAAGLPEFLRSVELEPDSAKIRVRLAMAYEQLGELEKASEHYREIQRLDPFCPDGWYGAGQIAARLKNSEQALTFFLRGTTNCPTDYTLHAKAAEHLTYARRYAEALAAAKRSFAINSDQGPAIEHSIKVLELLKVQGAGEQKRK